MSRAIGETMTVLMAAGGAAIIPKTLGDFFSPVRPMTATIAAEMGEAAMGSAHYHALFAIGLVLFIITFIFNIVAEIISRRFRLKLGLGM
jgi:phosphate transport system permease protein